MTLGAFSLNPKKLLVFNAVSRYHRCKSVRRACDPALPKPAATSQKLHSERTFFELRYALTV